MRHHRRTLDLEQLSRCYFGGKPAGAAAVPPPVPPVTETRSEITDAQRQTKLDAARRKGAQSTILAGGTLGAPNTQVTPFGGKTLLGGNL